MLNKFRQQHLIWDFANKHMREHVVSSSGDLSGRTLAVTIYDAGAVVDMTGTELYLSWQRKSGEFAGKDKFTATDITKGEYELTYTPEMTSHAGHVLEASLRVEVGAEAVIESRPFEITVLRSVYNEGAEKSGEFSLLQAALVRLEDIEAGEADRQSQESVRITSESDRETAENIREGNETGRIAAEALRESAEAARQEAYATAESARESQYEAAEDSRDTAYAQAETERDSSYATAESSRGAAFDASESARESSELTRIDNESAREANESVRESAEAARKNDETSRGMAESARADAEASRVNAESTRVDAESLRNTRETERSNAEADRVSSEATRKAQEETRKTSEQNRISSENTRADQEETRQINETNRMVFESYDPAKNYKIGNKVAYSGSSYRALKASKGITPGADSTTWLLFAMKGDPGEIENLAASHIENALGYIPLSEDSLPSNLETTSGSQAKADQAEQNAKTYADAGLADKVDKVSGKVLSTNDYTTVEKNKLAGVETGAQVNTITSVAGRTGAVIVSKSDVGLSNVDNVKQMPISGGVLENYREKLVAVDSPTINLIRGNVFHDTPTLNRTYSITNAVNGQAHSFTLMVTQTATVRTLTFPASVIWQGGEIPDLTTASKTYLLTFVSVDGGTTWLGMFGGEF